MTSLEFTHFIPTKLIFGCGKLNMLATEPMPGKKAMIVISSGASMRKYGYLDRVVKLLIENNGIESVIFDKVQPNPTKVHVMEAAEICRNEGCDFVIGLGGGSSIDTAKSVALMAKNEGDYWDYVPSGSGKGKPFTNGALPIIAIPTTAGTGTEADPWTVITDEKLKEKIGIGNQYTFPYMSIVDPELMVSVPPRLTAYQGFDAFFHAAEGYIASCATPLSDLYALESMRLLYKYLPAAINNGNDLKARTKVALASMLAGMVESTSSCTSEHSLEHAMSAYYPSLPHGAGLIAISLAYFATFKNDCMKRYMKMAETITEKKSARPSDFLEALETMQKQCGVNNIKLSDFGVTPKDFNKLKENARMTMGGLFACDPRPITGDEIMEIFKKSYR